ncbi:MAG: hypothetical protein K2H98_06515 [Duncaniella sp.]|nr:hypothetical protein [Duncaniella sp.]
MDNYNEIDFIARRYKAGSFKPGEGWRRLGIAPVSVWKRFRGVAVVTATVVLTAAATVIYTGYSSHEAERPQIEAPVNNTMAAVKVIDFENAPLTEVVGRIEEVYNVTVDNLPDDAAGYSLSLHYEGTPGDLIDVINDILGTHLTVRDK